MQEQNEEFTKKIKEHKVDRECSLKNVRVFKDYSCTLSLTDVAYGSFGHNKFYKIQLLERMDQRKWFVWTHWGRIGADGQQQQNEFFDKHEAMAFFEKRFASKTEN